MGRSILGTVPCLLRVLDAPDQRDLREAVEAQASCVLDVRVEATDRALAHEEVRDNKNSTDADPRATVVGNPRVRLRRDSFFWGRR